MKLILCISFLVALLTTGLVAGTNQITQGMEPYRLGPGDKLTYFLREDPLNYQQKRVVLEVNQEGEILVPVTFNLPQQVSFAARNKTLAELSETIKHTYEQKYYEGATVEFKLLEKRQSARKLVVCGEFESTVYLDQDRPLSLAALLRNLAPGPFTNLEAIEIYHQSADGTVRSQKINWLKMSEKHEDFQLYSGDIVHLTRGTRNRVAWHLSQKK